MNLLFLTMTIIFLAMMLKNQTRIVVWLKKNRITLFQH